MERSAQLEMQEAQEPIPSKSDYRLTFIEKEESVFHVCHNHEWKLCQVEEHQHQLGHQCSPNIIGIWEWGICGFMGGAFIT